MASSQGIAYILDALILAAIFVPIYYLWVAQQTPKDFETAVSKNPLDLASSGLLLVIALVMVHLFYFVGSWHILSASPGMLVLNLRIVDKEGGTPGFGQALVRWFFLNLFGILNAIPIPCRRPNAGSTTRCRGRL